MVYTVGYVFAKLDHEAFPRRFVHWVEAVTKVTRHLVVAIDGVAMMWFMKIVERLMVQRQKWLQQNGDIVGCLSSVRVEKQRSGNAGTETLLLLPFERETWV